MILRLIATLLLVVCPSSETFAQPAAARARMAEGQRAMAEGRFEEAAAAYRDVLKSLPDEPGVLMNLGMALAMAGREQEAVELLERAVKLQPSLIPARLFLGSSYLALGQAQKAAPLLEGVVAAQPTDVESRRLAASAWLDAGVPERAVGHLRQLTTLQPKNPSGWYALGQAYNAIVQTALESFDRDPADAPWRAVLTADALAEDGRHEDAFPLYKDALPVVKMRSVHESLARIYEKTGHADWAAEQRSRARAVPLECATSKAACEFLARRFRGALAATDGRPDAASRFWRARAATELARSAFSVLETLPDSQELHEYRAELARSQDQHMEAVQEIRRAMSFSPDDPRLTEELARSFYLARDYSSALPILAELTKAFPDSPALAGMYGDSLLQLQRLDEAVPWLERAIKDGPEDAAARAALGRAYVQKGEFAAAIPLLEPLLPADEDGSLHVQLARALQGTGQGDKAAPLLERSRELQQAAQTKAATQGENRITPPD